MKPRDRHKIIPTDLEGNLRFRRDMLSKCQLGGEEGKAWRRIVTQACAEDPLFFFNGMCWVYEPRPRFTPEGIRLPDQVPFIAWDHQIPAITEIYNNLGIKDIGLEKSRGEGASWIGVLLAMHSWIFRPLSAIGLVSRDENSVDDANDPDSLMWKCDFILKKLPDWLSGLPVKDFKRDVTKHVLRNLRNESTISGYSAVANVGSGGRKFFFLMDELAKFPRPNDEAAMASTQHVTECRFIVSTPLGNTGAYYDVMHAPSGENFAKVVLDWKQNPTRNRGLYNWIDGRAIAIDPINNPLPAKYDPPNEEVLGLIGRLRRKGFRIEERDRSPWYDKECDRAAATPQNIAQELDRDYGGSAHRVFGDKFFKESAQHLMPPTIEGDLDFKEESITDFMFNRMDGGPMKLWVPLDSRDTPPVSTYAIGCDVAVGTGGSFSSNSTIVVVDVKKGEQVLEYALNTIPPINFADLAVAVARWFHGAYLAWEHNGPGSGFTKQVLSRNYDNIYRRTSQSRLTKTKTKEAGWWTDERTKEIMIAELQRQVVKGGFIIRSRDMVVEAGQYVREGGKITNAIIKTSAEDSKGASHGDRIIAACVAMQAVSDRPGIAIEDTEAGKQAIAGTMAERMQEYEKQDAEAAEEGWDDGIFANDGIMG